MVDGSGNCFFVALEMGVFQTLGCLEGYVCVRNAVFGFLIMVETGCYIWGRRLERHVLKADE